MIAYKLVRRRKDGSLGPLFIDKKFVYEPGAWLKASPHPTKGYKNRPGFHCCLKPHAPHIAGGVINDSRKSAKDRVWIEVLVGDYEIIERPDNQGGTWVLAQDMLVRGEVDESFLLKVNNS